MKRTTPLICLASALLLWPLGAAAQDAGLTFDKLPLAIEGPANVELQEDIFNSCDTILEGCAFLILP